MPKAYNLLLKVQSADLKFDPTLALGKDLYCEIRYGAYIFRTKDKLDSDAKTPKWKDEFDITYYRKDVLVFSLFDSDQSLEQPRLLCSGETDISKKIQSDGELKVPLKSSTSKTTGNLQVNLKWIGDYELTPFRLEIVVHTVDVSGVRDFGSMGEYQVWVASSDSGRHERQHLGRD